MALGKIKLETSPATLGQETQDDNFFQILENLGVTSISINEDGAVLNLKNPGTIQTAVKRLRSLGLTVQQRDDSIFVSLEGQNALARALRKQAERDAHFDLESAVTNAMQAIKSYNTKTGQ